MPPCIMPVSAAQSGFEDAKQKGRWQERPRCPLPNGANRLGSGDKFQQIACQARDCLSQWTDTRRCLKGKEPAHLGGLGSAGGAPSARKVGLQLRRLAEQLAGVGLWVGRLLGGVLGHPAAHHIPEHLRWRVRFESQWVCMRARHPIPCMRAPTR